MGRVKESMMAGYSSCGDLSVCTSCFGNEAIKAYIESYNDLSECSYCDSKNRKSCKLNYVVEHIVESINFEWDDPTNAGVGWDSAEGGWLGVEPVYTCELLTTELDLDIENDNLIYDINSSILNTEWCKKLPYSLDEDQRLLYGWQSFSDFVKHNSRYVLFKTDENKKDQIDFFQEKMEPEEVLKSIGLFINQHNLISTVNTSEKIYRVRIVDENISFDNNEEELGSPPTKFCTFANRMSPAGISMFYGAFDIDTAIKETYEPERNITKKAICGLFNPTRQLTLINLSEIPPVPSLFDENRCDRDSLSFLSGFIKNFCKPIERADKAHIDYVPTQIVTEYFRYVLCLDTGKRIDGVIYPSSKDNEKKCIVIFANSEQCRASNSNYINDKEHMLNLNNVVEKQLTTNSLSAPFLHQVIWALYLKLTSV
jgi:hypothetical protein